MNDHRRNPSDDDAWPTPEVLNGWAHDLGAYQIGFSLTPAWRPPPDSLRRTDSSNYIRQLRQMNFPEKLTAWMLEQFLKKKIAMISVVRRENRWLVHIGLSLDPNVIGLLLQLVDDLTAAANLPVGGDGQSIAQMERIGEENPDYSEMDIRYHLIGDRVKEAVQEMFNDI